MKKRILNIFLCVLMCISLVPMGAFAEETSSLIPDEQTFYLVSDGADKTTPVPDDQTPEPTSDDEEEITSVPTNDQTPVPPDDQTPVPDDQTPEPTSDDEEEITPVPTDDQMPVPTDNFLKKILSSTPNNLMLAGTDDSNSDEDETPAGPNYTFISDIDQLCTSFVIEGATYDSTTNTYSVKANTDYRIAMTFEENSSFQMEPEGSITFSLPEGTVVNPVEGNVTIMVKNNGVLGTSVHPYKIEGNTVTITWDKDDSNYETLSISSNVELKFKATAQFNGGLDEIKFGTGTEFTIKVDNTGTVSVQKNFTGFENMTEDQKTAAMKH